MAAYDAPSRASVPSLVGAVGLQTLLLRIYDHQRHIFEWARTNRPDAGIVFPSITQIANDRGTREFSIYDLMKFTHPGASLTNQGCVNEVCDAHQIHPHMRQWNIPNRWTGGVPAATDITPYHYWKAAEQVRATRASGGLPDNTRPLIASEVGIDYLAQNSGGRADLFQLRRLKFGMLSIGCLYYGCSLINFYAVGRSSSAGYNLIDSTVTGTAAISFVGAGAVVGSTGNVAISPGLPVGIQQGDLLICVAYSRTNTGTHSTPWTSHFTLNVDPHYLSVEYTIASGSGIDASPVVTPDGLAVDQTTIVCVLAFRGVDRTTPFGTPGANSTNAAAEDIGPVAAATPLVTDSAAVVIGCRAASSAGGIVSPLTGDSITWTEAVDGGIVATNGCHMTIDYTTWTGTIPTLTAKTFDVAAGLTGASCGKMLLLRGETSSSGGYFGSGGERDADFAFQALDAREASDAIPLVSKTWQSYWKEWQVACDVSATPIAGNASVCPFPEWNRVTMGGGTVLMAAGGWNVLARKKNLRRGVHTFSCELKLSAGAQACLAVSGHDKLNGLALVSSSTLTGTIDWTQASVSFSPRQHNNPRIPDPRVCVLMVDHNGTGTCEVRNPQITLGGTVTPPDLYFDLQVIDITWSPANPLAGESVTFSALVYNNGTAPSPSGTIHGVAFAINGTNVSWSDNVTASLADHAQRVQTANGGPGGLATWTAVAGAYSVQAWVDDINRMPTERDKTNNILTKTISVTTGTGGGLTPPAPAAAAGLSSLFFNDEFTSLNFYHATTNPIGTWRFNDYWQSVSQAGYVDLGGARTFCINQSYPDPILVPYMPASQPEASVMRLTMRRARLSERPTLRTLVNTIAVAQTPGLLDMVTWLGAFMTTETTATHTATDINRPAYIEARMRFLPANIEGGFESFWLYATSESGDAHEIDIFENNAGTYSFWQTNVHGGSGANMRFLSSAHPWRDGNWHTFGLLWEPAGFTIYHDGVVANEVIGVYDGDQKYANPNTSALAQSYSTSMRIIITACAVATWQQPYADRVVPTNVEQITMDFDWIRVWRPGTSTVRVFPATGTLATGYAVTAGGQNSPVYPVTINTWYRTNPNTIAPGGTDQERWDAMEAVYETAGFTAFEMSGTSVPVSVQFTDRTVTSAKVYPVRHGITPTISGGNTVNFNVTRPGKYIVMINNTEVRACHIFVHPIDTTAPTASGPGVVYYGPGTHNIGTITVANATAYYIAGGARVVGNFNVAGKTGFSIKGRGIVQSSSNFLVGDGASNFAIEGITILRPLNSSSDWTFKQRNCNNFLIDGVNVFTCEVTRDGIDSVSCRDYTIRNCFARTLDDPCCINAAFAGLGDIDLALIEDCVFMPDSGIGGAEIGASMECTYARNITYRRIDMINPRIQMAISIFNSDYADVYNIRYEDIHVDGFKGSVDVASCWLAKFFAAESSFSALPYTPGKVREVDLYNVTFINTAASLCKMHYKGNSSFSVGPIRWHNLMVNGSQITSAGQLTSVTNEAFVGTVTYDTATS